MGSDVATTLRRAAVPFLAGAAAAAAVLHGLYATATVSLLVALWAAAVVGRVSARRPLAPALLDPVSAPRDEERRLRLYLDLSPAPLVALDAGDRLRAVNRAARRLFGAEELVPAAPAGLVASIHATAPGAAATVRVDAGGGVHAYALLTADLAGAAGMVRVAALVDIDADLRAAEAATLQELVRVLGHEVTNTLTPIASLSATAATMLAEPAPDLPAVAAALETVARRALALQRFGESYRDLARLPLPSLQTFDLSALSRDLARLFSTRWPTKPLHLSAPSTLSVSGDPDQLAQALWALLQNAAEAGETVTLTLAPAGRGAAITLADDGNGVLTDDVGAIFRPFFTTKVDGSGVGLALARQIFRLHGGDLTLVQARPSAIFAATL